jgi:hypothetical protein
MIEPEILSADATVQRRRLVSANEKHEQLRPIQFWRPTMEPLHLTLSLSSWTPGMYPVLTK